LACISMDFGFAKINMGFSIISSYQYMMILYAKNNSGQAT